MILWYVLACGLDTPMPQPTPPPGMPPELSAKEVDVITHTGVVGDVQAGMRTWMSNGDGQRLICHLIDRGVLEINGHPALVADLLPGMAIVAEGKEVGDLLLVQRAVVVSTEAVPTSADAPADAQAVPPAAPPNVSPAGSADVPPVTPVVAP